MMKAGFVLRIAVSLCVFAIVFFFVDTRGFLTLITAAAPGWLAVALAATLLGFRLTAQVLSAICGGDPPAARVFRVNLISMYFGTFLPGELAAGFVSRLRYLGMSSWQMVLNRTVLERLVSLASFSVLAAAALSFTRFWEAIGPIALVLPAGVVMVAAIALAAIVDPRSPLRRFAIFRRLLEDEGVDGASPRVVISATAFAWSVAAQLVLSVVPYAILRGIDVRVGYAESIVIGYFLTIAQLVPFFFAGIGIRDVSAVALLATIGIASEVAFAFSTITLGIVLVVALIGGGFQMQAEGRRGP